jgi:hypothetical protein
MGNLALIYGEGGWLKEAEELAASVAERQKKLVGQEHPDTLLSMGNALIYTKLGRLDEAETLSVRVVELRKKVLGPQHLSTTDSMGNLAVTWSSGLKREE